MASTGGPSWTASDEKGPVMVYAQQGQAADDSNAPAIPRRSAALLWMGGLLGGAVIGAAFLALLYFRAMGNEVIEGRHLNEAQAKVVSMSSELGEVRARSELLQRDNDALNLENAELRHRLHMPPRPTATPMNSVPNYPDHQ